MQPGKRHTYARKLAVVPTAYRRLPVVSTDFPRLVHRLLRHFRTDNRWCGCLSLIHI